MVLSGWWYTPSEKYEFVSWDYSSQHIQKKDQDLVTSSKWFQMSEIPGPTPWHMSLNNIKASKTTVPPVPSCDWGWIKSQVFTSYYPYPQPDTGSIPLGGQLKGYISIYNTQGDGIVIGNWHVQKWDGMFRNEEPPSWDSFPTRFLSRDSRPNWLFESMGVLVVSVSIVSFSKQTGMGSSMCVARRWDRKTRPALGMAALEESFLRIGCCVIRHACTRQLLLPSNGSHLDPKCQTVTYKITRNRLVSYDLWYLPKKVIMNNYYM